MKVIILTRPAFYEPGEVREDSLERKRPEKRVEDEQIVTKQRQVEVLQSHGKSISAACKEAGLTEQRSHRYRKECGGLNDEQARKLKSLELENGR